MCSVEQRYGDFLCRILDISLERVDLWFMVGLDLTLGLRCRASERTRLVSENLFGVEIRG